MTSCFPAAAVRELPPICSDVRQKQRLSIDTLPQEVKAPFPCDPVIPIRTKTTKEFQWVSSLSLKHPRILFTTPLYSICRFQQGGRGASRPIRWLEGSQRVLPDDLRLLRRNQCRLQGKTDPSPPLLPGSASVSSLCLNVPQREANGLFNTIEDSGVNGKFVSAVYDSLLSTVSTTQNPVLMSPDCRAVSCHGN